MRWLPLGCLLVLHSPDGSELVIENAEIRAVRQIGPQYHDHLPKGTNAVIYLGVRPNGFGVKETVQAIEDMKKGCEGK